MSGQSHTDLIAWQKAVDLVCSIYKASGAFPTDERFGLISQIRRAAVSIAANIAEGQGRNSRNEFVHFLSIAHGSIREVETHVVIANRLGFLQDADKDALLKGTAEVGRLVSGLAKSLRVAD